MDIAATSTAMNQTRLSQEVSIRVLKMSNDQASQMGQDIIKMMEQSVKPNLGGNIDIKI
ncbi:YjfB family protein [Paenibacillus apiarius]|uniref:YjfB family protein n=1 Tax=Paenibacillus apiarius TaxID=46240 RepID=A0ABT4DY52_9BACL|nr:YjfB family protein [Paenibacillus apiarius]MCY9515981.1 YjfB family protein [Paenibacillus apiarius]MCY9520891.1 YjfB family protein [Paenibacillus apiarius]MCY9553596.1 YjfB family protein [Paenibacillus apiarius]MCY9557881.1 YjfB family protein [Paenibacillus apiarius]MCY9685736.1 YjfB family protein [Paenibacillus apiarius]